MFDGGIGNEDIDRAVCFEHFIGKSLRRTPVGKVCFQYRRCAAGRPGHLTRARLITKVMQDQFRSMLRKAKRNSPADAGTGTGHQHAPTFQ